MDEVDEVTQVVETLEAQGEAPENLDIDDKNIIGRGIQLHGAEDLNDKKTLGLIKQTFKKLDWSSDEDASKQFKDSQALVDYIQTSLDELNFAKQQGDKQGSIQNAAILGRFWCMAERLDSALKSGKYGSNIVHELTVATGWAQSTLYSIRNVAVKLTINQCYLLGERGCRQTHLRRLAGVSDDGMRDSIITGFLEHVKSTESLADMEMARKQLVSACTSSKGAATGFLTDSTSDPTNGGTPVDTCPEYSKGISTLKALKKLLFSIADNDKFVDLRDNMANMYIPSDAVDGDKKEAAAHELAHAILDMIPTAIEHLNTLAVEAQSIEVGLKAEGK